MTGRIRLPERKNMAIKNKKCCVCSTYTNGKGLENNLGTAVCLPCARAIRDIMLLQEGVKKDRNYCQPVIQDSDCYIPPFPLD